MEKSYFFNSRIVDGMNDRVYSAEDIAAREACFISDGVIKADSLRVRSVSSNIVNVSTGAASIRGYTYINTNGVNLTIESGDTAYDRIDAVVLRLDLDLRSINAAVVKGTPSESPVSPSLTSTTSVKEIPLAEVFVGAGTTPVIGAAHIKDTRILATYASLGDDVAHAIKEYIGEIDPVNGEEIASLRDIIETVRKDKSRTAVLCGDGRYREAPLYERVVARRYASPGTFSFMASYYPSANGLYDVEICGAGGGGGSYNGTAKRGGGGGGGAYLQLSGIAVPKDTVTVTVGKGGEGGMGTDGADGGKSAFDGFTAAGGDGGKGGSATDGGKGGVGIFTGLDGTDGKPDSAGELTTVCGKGGDSYYGIGAAAPVGKTAAGGNDAAAVGAGGSGASCNGGAFDKKGGNGADGTVVVYRYLTITREATNEQSE